MDLFQLLRQNQTPIQKFENAIKNNDIPKVEEILSEGMDPNTVLTKHGGDTALHFAARAGHFKIIKALIAHGANPDVTNDLGITPLFDAVRSDHGKATEELLRNVNKIKDIEGLWLWDSRIPSIFLTSTSDEVISLLIRATPYCNMARENLRKNMVSICLARKFYKCLKYWIYCGNSIDDEHMDKLNEILAPDPTVLPDVVGNQLEEENIKAEFRDWLVDFRKIPGSLQYHCGISIRRSFHGNCNVFRGVRDMNLPEALKSNICFI